MSRKLATRIDPEDVVMSAYRSFFVRAGEGKFQIENSGDLWRLLVEMTCHKLYRQSARHRAQKRSMNAEEANATDRVAEQQPSPDMAALVADELEYVMQQMNDVGRKVLELRLQDYTRVEIAEQLDISERTVRRYMAKAKTAIVGDMAPTKPMKKEQTKTASRRKLESDTPPLVAPEPSSFSDYRLLQQVGYGATGKVYRARQHSTGNSCAIKYLRKELVRDEQVIERFDREAAILASIDHPSVIRIEGHGATPGGGRFLVMELIDGGDLQTRLAQSQAGIEICQAVDWVAQACEGIAAANAAGIVHCDLKPANLLLRTTNEVVVTDFGLAREVAGSTASWFAGTPAFMAPEQIDPFFGPIDARTDVYGLGMCLYALLVGRTAFETSDATERLAKIVSEIPPDDPRLYRSEIPNEIAEGCLRAIQKTPIERYESGLAFGKALRDWLDDIA